MMLLRKRRNLGVMGLVVEGLMFTMNAWIFATFFYLGFSGPKFTWTNCRDISNLIQQHLDRVWVNSNWKIYYPKAIVSHLVRINSDHCPLLLSLDPNLG